MLADHPELVSALLRLQKSVSDGSLPVDSALRDSTNVAASMPPVISGLFTLLLKFAELYGLSDKP